MREACTKTLPPGVAVGKQRRRLRTGSPAVVVEDGVDAARWSMRQRHTVLEARARDDEDMSADILADAGDHRREEDEDGSAGCEGVGRVALQLVERMAARTRKQNAKSAGNV